MRDCFLSSPQSAASHGLVSAEMEDAGGSTTTSRAFGSASPRIERYPESRNVEHGWFGLQRCER